MGKNKFLTVAAGIAGVLALAGCSGQSDVKNANAVPVTLTIHDAPAGASVLAFQVQISGITLQDSSSSSSTSLLTNPVTVQLSSLTTQSELLAQLNVPAGTYSGMTITLSGASATIYNSSGSTTTLGGTTCNTGTACQYTPTLNQSSVTITGSPFPLTLSTGTPVAIALDLNLGSSLQPDGTITPSITAATTTTALADGNLVDIGGVTGQVTAVGNNSITIKNSNTGLTQTFNTSSSTNYGTFTGCAANNFTCLQTNQLVTLNYGVGAAGTASSLTATTINPFNNFTQGVGGTVISTNPTNGSYNIVVTQTSPSLTGVTAGQIITINPSTSATYGISAGQIAPNGSAFAGINDVIPGQNLFVNSTGLTAATGGELASVAADQVQLTPSQLSGNITALNSPNFTLGGLNGFYGANGVNNIQVNTGTTTAYQNVTGSAFTGLTNGSNYNLGGYLFNSASGPVFTGAQVNGVTTPLG